VTLDVLCAIVRSLRTTFRSSNFSRSPGSKIFRIGDDHPQCAGDHVAVLGDSSSTSLYLIFSSRRMDAKLIN
jgi:hypothetical protein